MKILTKSLTEYIVQQGFTKTQASDLVGFCKTLIPEELDQTWVDRIQADPKLFFSKLETSDNELKELVLGMKQSLSEIKKSFDTEVQKGISKKEAWTRTKQDIVLGVI